MARNAWGTAVVTAFGTAAVIGTAQLGVAYGLTMIDWRDGTAGLWSTNMAWTTWLAAVSTVLGAIAASIVAAAKGAHSVTVRLSSVLAAGLGAGVLAPLVALPARENAQAAVSGTPFLAVGIGIAAGLALALIAMAARPVAWSMFASTALIWLLALLSVAVPVGDKNMPVAQLGVWGSWADLTGALGKRGFALAPPLLVGSLLIGVIVALFATGNGKKQGIAAASGVVGPLLVTVAYLVAGPGTGTTVDSLSAFLVGPYAALVGLLGSLVVTLLRREKPSPPQTPVTTTAEGDYPPPPRHDGDDTVYERIPPSPTSTDPYVDEYTKALDDVDSAFGGKPQPAREGEDVPAQTAPDAPPPPKDDTEDWVTGLRDEEKTAPKKRTRRKS